MTIELHNSPLRDQPTNQSLADSLRALADAIEHMPGHLRPYVDFKVHGIQSLDSLKAVVALMDKPRPDHGGAWYWLVGQFAPQVNVTAFYQGGLLGEVVQPIGKTDLSLLEGP